MINYKGIKQLDMPMSNVNKSALVSHLSSRHKNRFDEEVIDEAFTAIIELMVTSLVDGGRVEVRGFGSFCVHEREPRMARNPRTGEMVAVSAKAVPFFKVGKALRQIVNQQLW